MDEDMDEDMSRCLRKVHPLLCSDVGKCADEDTETIDVDIEIGIPKEYIHLMAP